jgi:hypothetical protein
MRRLTLFLKGNVDVHDSLHSCRLGGKVEWNGINDIVRERHPGWAVRVKHETFTRSDALLRADGSVPGALKTRELPLADYPLESQFSRAAFETDADAIILSIQPDVHFRLARHRAEDFLLYRYDRDAWSESDRRWLAADFEEAPRLSVEQSMANFETIIDRIRERTEAPILVYNLSPIIPGESIHCYQGFDDSYSTRIRRFNLGLIDLSARTGVSIIDVETALARKGAEALKVDSFHLKPAGYRIIAEEVVRVLEDLGLFQE